MQPYQNAAHVATAKDEARWVTGNLRANRRDFLAYVLTSPKAERVQWAGYVIWPGKTAKDFLTMVSQPAQGNPAIAYIEENRWVARCPACNGAECVDPEDPEFFCFSCFNIENGGQPRPVSFPKTWQKTVRKLEQEPVRKLRNWKP